VPSGLHRLCSREFADHAALPIVDGGGDIAWLAERDGDFGGVADADVEKEIGEEWSHEVTGSV
jgi:hypothetical protein